MLRLEEQKKNDQRPGGMLSHSLLSNALHACRRRGVGRRLRQNVDIVADLPSLPSEDHRCLMWQFRVWCVLPQFADAGVVADSGVCAPRCRFLDMGSIAWLLRSPRETLLT